MPPIHTILFPTDLTDRANRSFPLACSLARECGARVVVLFVMPPPFGPEEIEARHRPDEYYSGANSSLRRLQPPEENVLVEHRLAEGDAATVILETAREVHAGLIVMGTHGRSGPGRLLLGNVAEQILRKASCPVLTVKLPPHDQPVAVADVECRTGWKHTWSIKTILHPTDFSACSADAFRLACSLARDHGAGLLVLHVTSVPDLAYKGYGAPIAPLDEADYLSQARRDLENVRPATGEVAVEHVLNEGDPVAEILRVAAGSRADLIVMGTHGRTGLRHVLMGSTAEKVVRKAPCPVLTVNTHAD